MSTCDTWAHEGDLNICVDHPICEPVAAIRVAHDGAEYIAQVMREEFERTADAGAFAIAEAIEKALKGGAA